MELFTMHPGFLYRLVSVPMLVLSLGLYLALAACGGSSNDAGTGTAGASKTLSWTAVPDSSVLGYKVYWGTESHHYDSNADAGPNPNYTVNGLRAGETYFFAVSAYNAGGESALSAEVSSVVQ